MTLKTCPTCRMTGVPAQPDGRLSRHGNLDRGECPQSVKENGPWD